MKELLSYLDRNGFTYDISDLGIITIDGDTYELSEPNVDGFLFDRGFNYIGTPISANNYIYKFGRLYYTLRKGDESKVKLKLLKYIGKVDSDLPTESFLGVRGPFELLNGTGDYRDWCQKAKFFGVEFLGICEKNTLAGVLKFQLECQKHGLKPVIGETVTVFNQKKDLLYDVKVYVVDETGWMNLLSINKEINVDNNVRIGEGKFLSLMEGLIAVVDPKSLQFKDVPKELERAYYQLDSVKFDSNERDKVYLLNLQEYFSSSMLPTNICDAYYLDQEYFYLKKALNSSAGISNDFSRNQYFKCNEEYLMEIRELFSGNDQDIMLDIIGFAIENTNDIAEKCSNFRVDLSQRHLPKYKMTEEEFKKYDGSKVDMLMSLVADGFISLGISDEDDQEKYLDRLETEIDVIKYGDVVDYFLILWDITQWCKRQGILVGFGRGSACGSLVAYLLGLTHINPFDYDLLFERFLNKGRVQSSLPDIDTDFEMARRPEVKRYMEERYGVDQVCSVGTYTTLQVKAAIKDLCRLKGVPVAEVNSFTSKIDGVKDFDDLFRIACQKKDVANFINRNPDIIQMVGLIQGQPKAKSIHACAMMIYPDEKDMYHWNPIRRQGDMLISEWEGGELDAAGFLKEDILGILQLSKFGDILKLIKDDTGEEINLYELPLDDPKVYSYFQRGWNGDVFHFGAKGLTGYCKMLKPDNITELVNCIGLYRPGVMEGNFHNEYILRKKGEREVSFRKGAGEILQSSRYIMIWQEQTMKMFQALGGFNLVEADNARRAIGKKNVEKLLPFKERFLKHYMEEFGVDQQYAEDTWKEIENMASYQFNHCVSGKTKLLRGGRANRYLPTVEEMYKIMNSSQYAKETGHRSLHDAYLRKGYGRSWSLNENGKLVVNNIKNIIYQGVRKTYKVTVEGGLSISVTDNHKFPTDRGDIMLKDMVVGDMIPVNLGYTREDTAYRFTDKSNSNVKYHSQSEGYREGYILNSQKGTEGFISKENGTSFTKLQYYKDNLMKDYCEYCGAKDVKLEVHHVDNCHGNNSFENLKTVCVSCHKKKHYEIGRTKMGRKGLNVEYRPIISIEFDKEEDVYDIEMDHPYHTFTIDNGIVTCNSHAVAYANTGYACQWLKVNYPLAFWSVAFSYADDEDFPVYLHEINEIGNIKVIPPDINESTDKIKTDFNDKSLVWSIASVKQVGEKAQAEIMKERSENGPYFGFDEFLDRHSQKGSAVNKSVIENLISCGAFDKLESISSVIDRIKLIKRYRTVNKVKIDKEKDVFELNPDKVKLEWWHNLRQKKLCGLAFFNYSKLYLDYFKEMIGDSEYPFKDFSEIVDDPLETKSYNLTAGGYVYEIAIKTGRKGDYAILTLEQNYQFRTVIFWSNEYESFENILKNCKDTILFMNGRTNWDERNQQMAIYANENTEVLMLT